MERTAYHVIANVNGVDIRISSVIGRPERLTLPITTLVFVPSSSAAVQSSEYPVTVHWKNDIPNTPSLTAAAERAVLDYCARLFNESAYEGPLDCCL